MQTFQCRIRTFLAALLFACAIAASDRVHADHRVALVIGNAAYRYIPALDNSGNDARLIAETLRSVGFTLVGGDAQLDLDKAALDRAVKSFGRALQGADVALFYYAGHGVQVRGANYLVPVNSNTVREADIDFDMLDTTLVLRQMEAAGTRLNLVILDACRNNPFGGRGLRSVSSGLAQMHAPEGTLISFATQPGNVALDGRIHSPFTAALSQTMRRPGLEVFQTFNEVGLAVKRATAGAQQPWLSSSPIAGTFYFVAEQEAQRRPEPPPSASVPSVSDIERAWAAVKDSSSPAILEAFIRRYGDGFYGELARARLSELKQVATSRTPEVQPTHDPGMEAVRSFYAALGAADGQAASSLVIPEKRASGPFNADAITKFYSTLFEPLQLRNVAALGNGQYQAEYVYRRNAHTTCDGSAIVTVVPRGSQLLIGAIKALRGC